MMHSMVIIDEMKALGMDREQTTPGPRAKAYRNADFGDSDDGDFDTGFQNFTNFPDMPE